MPTLDQDWRDADRPSRNGRWEEAGARWWALAQRCRADGLASRAQDAASRAADAFRRDDRPAAEAAALHARAMAPRDPPEASATPDQDLAHAFQGARLARLDGLLHAADAGFAAVAERLAPYPAAAAGLAAVHDSRAEVEITRASLARTAGRDPARWLDAASALPEEGATASLRARRRAGRQSNEALKSHAHDASPSGATREASVVVVTWPIHPLSSPGLPEGPVWE